jgi:hypothetical protein
VAFSFEPIGRFIAQSEPDPHAALWLGVRIRRNLNSIPCLAEEAVGSPNHNPATTCTSRIISLTVARLFNNSVNLQEEV